MFNDTKPRPVWPPRPGFFRLRLCRGGWPVPARIEHDEGQDTWAVTIDGVQTTGTDPVAANADFVWHHGAEIDDWHYADLLALKRWAAKHDPEHPCLSPRTPIHSNRLRPVIVPRSVNA